MREIASAKFTPRNDNATIYHRSWEEDVEPEKVFEVMLNVK